MRLIQASWIGTMVSVGVVSVLAVLLLPAAFLSPKVAANEWVLVESVHAAPDQPADRFAPAPRSREDASSYTAETVADLVNMVILGFAAVMFLLTVMAIAKERGSECVIVTTIVSTVIPLGFLFFPDWPIRNGYGVLWLVDIVCLFAIVAVAIAERRSFANNKWMIITSLINVLLPILIVAGVVIYLARDLAATA